METIENGLDQFLNDEKPTTKSEPKKVLKKKTDLLEKVDVDKKLVVEDGRELLREITYSRY